MGRKQFWLQKEDVLKSLRPGQKIYGVFQSSFGERNIYDYYCTGVRGLVFRLPRVNDYPSKTVWVTLDSVDELRGFVYVSKLSSKTWEPQVGDVCIGHVEDANNSIVKVCVAPDMIAEVTNYNDAYFKRVPAKFELCAIVLTSVNPLKGEVRAVPKLDVTRLVDRDTTRNYIPTELTTTQVHIPGIMIEKMQVYDHNIRTSQDAKQLIVDKYREAYSLSEVILDRIEIIKEEEPSDDGFGRKKGNAEKSQVIHFSFPIIKRTSGDPPIFIALKSDKEIPDGWFVEFLGMKAKGIHKLLPTHIQIDNYNSMLKDLASLALPENWAFSSVQGKVRPYLILDSYLCFTYYLVWFRNEFAEGNNGSLRIFNTGLVNYAFKPIYGVQKRIDSPKTNDSGKQWRMAGFAVAGEGQLGKEITTYITTKNLPQRIRFINDLSDLYLDVNAEIHSDFPHMILDNIKRLPIEMFLQAAPYNLHTEIEEIVKRMKSKNWDESHSAYMEMRTYLEEHSNYMRFMTILLDDAVEVAKSRTSWNYKTAIPVYYAARNCISLLLPLSIVHLHESGTESTKPDIALVVSRQPSGNYQGETILTLDMAYLDSRLITRPDSDWLTPEAIQNITEDLDSNE